MAGLDELVQRLQALGFSQYEARAYCALLQKSPANGHEVAKTAGIPTSKIYETLERLHQKEAVLVQRSEPTLWAPVPHRDLVAGLRQRMEATFSAVEQGLAQLGHEQDTKLTWTLAGRGHVVDSMRAAIDRAQKQLAAAVPAAALGELTPALRRAAERGVDLDLVASDGADLDLPEGEHVRIRRRPDPEPDGGRLAWSSATARRPCWPTSGGTGQRACGPTTRRSPCWPPSTYARSGDRRRMSTGATNHPELGGELLL